jgi:hypothetical protein
VAGSSRSYLGFTTLPTRYWLLLALSHPALAACTPAVSALSARHEPVSAAVGSIWLFGVALMSGVLNLSEINWRREKQLPVPSW